MKDPEVTGSAVDFLPPRISIASMRGAVDGCRGCPLYKCGNAVFGEGSNTARVMFVGEQPGDQEERLQQPFVGPAGRLLDEALVDNGIDRKETYVTNAVKHFKHVERGVRRIHKTPNDSEVRACYPWLEQEIEVIQPRLIVALGATAAQAMLGKAFRVTQQRGQAMETPLAEMIVATVHPSAVLRALPGERTEARRAFFADVGIIAEHLRAMT